MLLSSLQEYTSLGTAVAPGTNVTQKINRQRRRLEGIWIRVSGTSTVLTTPTTDSYGNVLKRIALEVNDGQKRFALDLQGATLLELMLRSGVSLPNAVVGNWGSSSTGAFGIVYYLPIRPLGLSDPAGTLTGIPLWILNEDVTLYLETGTTEVAATFTVPAGLKIETVVQYRQDYTANPTYVATELREGTDLSMPASSPRYVDIPWGGALLGLGMIGYSNAAGTTRAEPVGGTGLIQLVYGREVRRSVPTIWLGSQMGHMDTGVRSGYTSINESGMYWNLIDDLPSIGGFSVGSALNLEPVAAGGDQARIFITSTNTGTPGLRYYYLKAISGDISKLKLV